MMTGPIKRGLKLWSPNTGAYLSEARRLFAAGLYDYIELYVIPGAEQDLAAWQAVEIPFIIHAPHFAHGFNLAKAEKEADNRALYGLVKQYADALRAPFIIFHGGIDGSIEETARQLAALDEPRALIENKPYMALPNRMGGTQCRGYNVEEIKCVQDASGCGFCFDFGHAICAANSLEQEPYAYIEHFLANTSPQMYHLTDVDDMASPFDTHRHLGAGKMDIPRLLALVPQGCPITFETDKDSKENLNDFEHDMLWLQEHASA